MLIDGLEELPDGTRLLIMYMNGSATLFWRDDHRAQGEAMRWFRPGKYQSWNQTAVTWEEVTRDALSVWGLSEHPIATAAPRRGGL